MKPACQSLSIVFVAVALLLPAGAQDTAAVVGKAQTAMVEIQGQTHSGQPVVGAGFLVASNGTIVTSLHVVNELRNCSVQLANGDIFDSVAVLSTDERRDLAIIKIAGFDLPVIELGNSNQLEVGEEVFLLTRGTGTRGTITGIRQAEGFRVIQTGAAFSAAMSGAPLLNAKGQAVGVLGFKLRGSEAQFAVPINYARGMIENSATTTADARVIPSRPPIGPATVAVANVPPSRPVQAAPQQVEREAPAPQVAAPVSTPTARIITPVPEPRPAAPQPSARIAPAPEPVPPPAPASPATRITEPAPAPAKISSPLPATRKIYVASFGDADGAEMLREKIAKRLAQSGMFTVVNQAADADAVLTGAGVWKTGTVKSFTARLSAADDRLLWSSDVSTGGWVKSASSTIADKVVKGMVRALAFEPARRK